MVKNIKVGTSGYVFADWKGVFYPENLRQEDFLKFYQQHFNTVELNFSYYGMPKKENLQKLSDAVPDNFDFFIKAHQTMTHFSISNTSLKQVDADISSFLSAIDGLSKIKGILFQFPYGFRFSEQNFSCLKHICQKSEAKTIILEFRHKSWLNYAVSDWMKACKIVYCCVDEPQLPEMLPPIVRNFGHITYLRFHGRNKEKWWSDSKENSQLRYDYLYSGNELDEWTEKINYLSCESEMLYIFFNNCHLGKAVRNARMMQEKLGITHSGDN